MIQNKTNHKHIFKKIISILKNNRISRISIFGSYARGENNLESDIDIMVKFSVKKSLLEIVKIERELYESIGIKVDLLTEKSISPYLIDKIRREEKVIYERKRW